MEILKIINFKRLALVNKTFRTTVTTESVVVGASIKLQTFNYKSHSFDVDDKEVIVKMGTGLVKECNGNNITITNFKGDIIFMQCKEFGEEVSTINLIYSSVIQETNSKFDFNRITMATPSLTSGNDISLAGESSLFPFCPFALEITGLSWI